MKPEVAEYWLELLGLALLVMNVFLNSNIIDLGALGILAISVLLDKPS
jgi:hypothetical protein